jgi:hypothetical protein
LPVSLVYADGCIRPAFSNPEARIDISGRLAFVTLVAPAAALAVMWSVETWRRMILARSWRLTRHTGELEERLEQARGELGEWERRALSAAAALAEVAAGLPWDLGAAERRIARLADDLRASLAREAVRPVRVIQTPRVPAPSRPAAVRAGAVMRERSA